MYDDIPAKFFIEKYTAKEFLAAIIICIANNIKHSHVFSLSRFLSKIFFRLKQKLLRADPYKIRTTVNIR